jgi:hypothetical protein
VLFAKELEVGIVVGPIKRIALIIFVQDIHELSRVEEEISETVVNRNVGCSRCDG